MMVAFKTAQRLDWGAWVMGIWGAAVSGGAGAVSAGFGTMVMDPKDFNLGAGGSHHLFELMGICFGFSAFISLMKYLQTHPAPDPLTINTTGTVNVNNKTIVNPPSESK